MDPTSKWEIWNYSTKDSEWKDGKYTVLAGQADDDNRFIWTDEIELSGAVGLAATTLAVTFSAFALL